AFAEPFVIIVVTWVNPPSPPSPSPGRRGRIVRGLHMLPRIFAFVAILGMAAGPDADQLAKQEKQKTPREALLAFSDLIGEWRCTGTPVGSQEDKQKGFWTEKMAWHWQFEDKDAWLKIAF